MKHLVYNFEYNKLFVCVCQNHIHVVTTMVAASIYAFHHGRKDILWCSVCVRQVINPCGLESVCVSNIVLHYDYVTNLLLYHGYRFFFLSERKSLLGLGHS